MLPKPIDVVTHHFKWVCADLPHGTVIVGEADVQVVSQAEQGVRVFGVFGVDQHAQDFPGVGVEFVKVATGVIAGHVQIQSIVGQSVHRGPGGTSEPAIHLLHGLFVQLGDGAAAVAQPYIQVLIEDGQGADVVVVLGTGVDIDQAHVGGVQFDNDGRPFCEADVHVLSIGGDAPALVLFFFSLPQERASLGSQVGTGRKELLPGVNVGDAGVADEAVWPQVGKHRRGVPRATARPSTGEMLVVLDAVGDGLDESGEILLAWYFTVQEQPLDAFSYCVAEFTHFSPPMDNTLAGSRRQVAAAGRP